MQVYENNSVYADGKWECKTQPDEAASAAVLRLVNPRLDADVLGDHGSLDGVGILLGKIENKVFLDAREYEAHGVGLSGNTDLG
jgi:hypothetical protein